MLRGLSNETKVVRLLRQGRPCSLPDQNSGIRAMDVCLFGVLGGSIQRTGLSVRRDEKGQQKKALSSAARLPWRGLSRSSPEQGRKPAGFSASLPQVVRTVMFRRPQFADLVTWVLFLSVGVVTAQADNQSGAMLLGEAGLSRQQQW